MTFGPRTDDLAALARRQRLAVVVDDADLLARQRQPDGAGLAQPSKGLSRRSARALGEPVALDEHDAEAFARTARSARRGIGAAPQTDEAAATRCPAGRPPAARSASRRSPARPRSRSAGPARPIPKNVFGLEPAGDRPREPPASSGDSDADDDPVDVEQRQDQQAAIGGGHARASRAIMSAIAARLAWSSITPLGSPVVPLV